MKNYLVCRDTLVKMVEDCIIWFKFSGYLFNFDNDVYVCLCYNTPIGSSREIFNDKNIFDMIVDDMVEFEAGTDNKCIFLIWGDLNARTGGLPDYVEYDNLNFLDISPDDYVVSTRLFLDCLRTKHAMNMVKIYCNFVKILV